MAEMFVKLQEYLQLPFVRYALIVGILHSVLSYVPLYMEVCLCL